MNKKAIISGAVVTTLAVAATFGGCSLVTPNLTDDMNQIVAEVNIANAAALDAEYNDYKEIVKDSSVIKRDLITYFVNVGYTYVQNYGYSYSQTFQLLMNSLVENEVLTQYATMYLLKHKAEEENKTAEQIIAEYNAQAKDDMTDDEKTAAKYEWLLGGADSKDVMIAEYSLLKSLNTAIDSYEQEILEEDSSGSGTATRSTPSGVDTEQEDFYPQKEDGSLDYNVYTGYNGYLIADSGVYQDNKLDKTTRATRARAYKEFISRLASSSYNLIDKTTDDLRDIRSIAYIKNEYVSQLEQRIINVYYDLYEAEREAELLAGEEGDYSYLEAVYNDLVKKDRDTYKTESGFASALSNMSDSTFLLYAPDTSDEGRFGYVYNILLPFSASQSAKLSELQKLYTDDDVSGGYSGRYYEERNNLLSQIKTTDQRSPWFNGETQYAFLADDDADYYNGGNADRTYLFFENNLKYTERYEAIDKYDGRYSYNGKVVETDDGYVLLANELDMDDMLNEFVAYVNYALNSDGSQYEYAKYKKTDGYYIGADEFYETDDETKIDYSKFVYAEGQIRFDVSKEFSTVYDDSAEKLNRANLLVKQDGGSIQYRALSAVNELQYAYTTDTGVLSQYIGYSVEAGDTSYIKEFEYAAHEAVKRGAGHFMVCAGDYGWHLIYVTYTFSNGGDDQYEPDWTKINVKGTFENLFYEMVKSNDIQDISTTRRTQIITEFKSDSTVTTYESRYKDLLEMDS